MKTAKTAAFSSLTLFILGLSLPANGAEKKTPPSPQLAALNAYFDQQVTAIEGQLDREIKTKEDWLARKDEYRRQLREMLGLDPLPPRTDLKATKTGEFEHEGVIVENMHYQSKPGLYVTANLYRPKVVEKPLPTILYVCGHAVKEKNGVRYGNKAGYEHHGMWYAKHGFVCLVIDTVQLGEIQGEHHGTYSKDRLWWFSRGYTPAGVEAWAGMRALDYLETRPEVDKKRFGVTGRSGGGAYSWWIAALDERIACAAPTAGITTLRNHIVDGCVEGHCDCMFMVNTYRWDYDKVAALVAPRPLCIVNTDKDSIFPVDGVFKIYQSTRRIYKLLDAEKNIGLQIAEGPHADTQPLNTGEFHWMTRFLQGAELMSTLDSPAIKGGIEMEKLRAFPLNTGTLAPNTKPTPDQLGWPADQLNTRIDESFVTMPAKTDLPGDGDAWAMMRRKWDSEAVQRCFGGWTTPALPFQPIWMDKNWKLDPTANVSVFVAEALKEGTLTEAKFDNPKLHRDVIEQTSNYRTPHGLETNTERDRALLEAGRQEKLTYGEVLLAGVEDQGIKARRLKLITLDLPTLDLFLIHPASTKLPDLELVVLNVLDEQGWIDFSNTYAHKLGTLFPKGTKSMPDDKAFEQEKKIFENFKWGMAYICPRGIGPTAWDQAAADPADKKAVAAAEKARVQRLRRFYLLGQTLEGQQVWDVRCAIRALRSVEGLKDTKLWLQASRTQAANVVMASLFEDNITRLDLHELPHSLMPTSDGKSSPVSNGLPAYLNMLKYLDMPQAVALAAERTRVVIYDNDKAAWSYPQQVSEKLGWGKEKKAGLQLRDVPKAE